MYWIWHIRLTILDWVAWNLSLTISGYMSTRIVASDDSIFAGKSNSTRFLQERVAKDTNLGSGKSVTKFLQEF